LIDWNSIVVAILLLVVVLDVDYDCYYYYGMIDPYAEEEEVLVDDDRIVGIDLNIVVEFVRNNHDHLLIFVMLLHDNYDHDRIDYP
jgi:hypothetical protein